MPVRKSVEIIESDNLTIYFPVFERIDLITGVMPDKSEEDVLFVCEAAFTSQLLEEFDHFNIAGHHVSGGLFYKGYKCGPNNGCFTVSSNFVSADFRKMRTDSFQKSRTTRFRKIRVVR